MKNSSTFLWCVLFIVVAIRLTDGIENIVLHNSHVRLTFIEGMPIFKFATSGVSIAVMGCTPKIERIGVTGFFNIFHITDGGWNHTFVEIQILQPIRDIEVFMVNVTIVGDPLIPARYQ